MNKRSPVIFLLLVNYTALLFSQTVWQAYDPRLSEPLNVAYIHNAGNGVYWSLGIKGNFSKQLWEYDESNAYILRSNNYGNNGVWNKYRFPVDSNIVGSLSAKSFTRAWLVTYDLAAQQSRIWRTQNGGYDWLPQEIGISNNSYLNVVQMWSTSKGVIVGDPVNGKFEIFKTTNGGNSWLKINNAPASENEEIGLICISYTFGKNLYMPTTTGRLLYTNDSGETWKISKTPLDFAEFVSFKNSTNGVIALNDYSVYPFKTKIARTTDGGTTWSSPNSADFAFFDLKYIPNTNTLIGTTRERNDVGPFKTVMSTDDGKTWKTLETGTPIANFNFTDDGVGIGGKFKNDDSPTKMYRFKIPIADLNSAN